MKRNVKSVLIRTAASMLVAIAISAVAAGRGPFPRQQAQTGEEKEKPSKTPALNRLTIEVSGGEKNQPVDNASVYLKFTEVRKLKKNKKFELNVKTNQDGVAHVPEPPTGRVLIQVVAEGWKPFGRVYEIEDLSQPIQIHLERPKHWY
jgi:hypothetical protein